MGAGLFAELSIDNPGRPGSHRMSASWVKLPLNGQPDSGGEQVTGVLIVFCDSAAIARQLVSTPPPVAPGITLRLRRQRKATCLNAAGSRAGSGAGMPEGGVKGSTQTLRDCNAKSLRAGEKNLSHSDAFCCIYWGRAGPGTARLGPIFPFCATGSGWARKRAGQRQGRRLSEQGRLIAAAFGANRGILSKTPGPLHVSIVDRRLRGWQGGSVSGPGGTRGQGERPRFLGPAWWWFLPA